MTPLCFAAISADRLQGLLGRRFSGAVPVPAAVPTAERRSEVTVAIPPPAIDKGTEKSVAPASGAKKKSKHPRNASLEKYVPEWDLTVDDTPDTKEGDRKNGREVVRGLASLPRVACCFDDRPTSAVGDILCNLLWKVCSKVFLCYVSLLSSCP